MATSASVSIQPSSLWRSIQASSCRTLSVMGMTKNTGKTVALNHVLAQAAAAGVRVDVTSIGRDGEAFDQVFQVPKPPVQVWPGSLVATARDTLLRAKAPTRWVADTVIPSPMGEIVLVQVLEQGEMEIAGASRACDQRVVITRLQQAGAALVLLDGALGRSQHASPAITDGVILATGAALGGGMHDVLRKTRDRLAILGIAQADAHTRQLTQPVFEQGGVGIWDQQGNNLLMANISTLNSAPALMQHAQVDMKTIALSGAVGRRLWRALQSLAQLHPDLTVVVNDGTKLFVNQTELSALQQKGVQVQAYQAIRLVGITLNPFSPFGGSFDATEFLAAARSALAGHTVCDVQLDDPMNTTGVFA